MVTRWWARVLFDSSDFSLKWFARNKYKPVVLAADHERELAEVERKLTVAQAENVKLWGWLKETWQHKKMEEPMSKLELGRPHVDDRPLRERLIERLDLAVRTARVDLAMVILSPYEAEAILKALRGEGPVPKGSK